MVFLIYESNPSSSPAIWICLSAISIYLLRFQFISCYFNPSSATSIHLLRFRSIICNFDPSSAILVHLPRSIIYDSSVILLTFFKLVNGIQQIHEQFTFFYGSP